MPTNFYLYHHFLKSVDQFQQLILFSNFLVSNHLLRWTDFSLWILHPPNQMFVFCVECSSTERSPARNNTAVVLNATLLYGAIARETITISYVASLEPQFVTIDPDSKEPTVPYGFGNQHPIVPPNLNDLVQWTTHLMCWLPWSWFEQTKNTARNHRSRLSRLQSLRPQWIWVPLKAGSHRTQPPKTIHSIPTMGR